ncbi:MAG: 3-oxoacyl-[acyl-carrier-protein] reductase [Bacteroidales bacterium]|nr:3-oxoacyl-[acyl-carrier-protein] reductase [Bacteroidales bacterium]
MLLKNQVAIITGATRGIGRALALRFAEEGCNIAFCGRTRNENMIAVENEIAALGVNAKGYAVDVTQFQASQDFVKQVVDDFGHIDILVNNAGITSDNALKRMTEEQWDSVINANLKSVFCMTKAVHPYLWKQGSGSIVNISSVVGIGGNYNQSNYAASKAGILGFTKAMAKEFGGRNIRINAVAPGFIVTEMTGDIPEQLKQYWQTRIPLRRPGTAREVANACLYYASELGTYNTGDIMHLCGGLEDA